MAYEELKQAAERLVKQEGYSAADLVRWMAQAKPQTILSMIAKLERVEPLPGEWDDEAEYTMPRDVSAEVKHRADILRQALNQ